MRSVSLFSLLLAACDGSGEDESTKRETSETGAEDIEDTAPEDTAPEDTGGTTQDPIAIAGQYTDIYGTTHSIDDALWQQQYAGYPPSIFAIIDYNNAEQHVIAQNDAANSYFPGLWSRLDWVEHEGHLYYCQTAYSAASESEAVDTPRGDDSDPAAGGCGGFPWTDLTP